MPGEAGLLDDGVVGEALFGGVATKGQKTLPQP